MPSPDLKPLVVIVGPTAVGKSQVAIQLSERLAGEILSADASQFYRGMDIGTAKPSQSERERIPHHLIDVANPDQTCSLAIFQQEAYQAINAIHQRGHLPILVGGTGQYVRAVTEGWVIPRAQPNSHLRQALESWQTQIGSSGLHLRLAVLDPLAAQSIDANNTRRTIRALEVILTTGQPFSQQRQRQRPLFHVIQIGLIRPRAELYARIDQRIELMLASGLIEEVRGLLAAGYPPDLPAMSAIGYREIASHLKGEVSLEEAVKLMKRRTRVFVRRQANWFKEGDAAIKWFHINETTIHEIEAFLRENGITGSTEYDL